jgi:SAM-dependent methyltransferase
VVAGLPAGRSRDQLAGCAAGKTTGPAPSGFSLGGRLSSPRWTRENLRHLLGVFWQGGNPAATVYDSIGRDFFLALAPGWLNLGLWEGSGTEDEAPVAVRRLVQTLAADLPTGGVVLDVGSGLGVQDHVIAEVARPRQLIALNITESQLREGRAALLEAGASPLAGDAMRIPLADDSVDGVISVEAAFHFRSRQRFFAETSRVLRPGGVLTMSDVPIRRLPRGPVELLAGLSQLRAWGLRSGAAATADEIAAAAESEGFEDVRLRLCGDRVIDPALSVISRRLEATPDVPGSMRLAARLMLAQMRLLRRRGVIDYLLLRAMVS